MDTPHFEFQEDYRPKQSPEEEEIIASLYQDINADVDENYLNSLIRKQDNNAQKPNNDKIFKSPTPLAQDKKPHEQKKLPIQMFSSLKIGADSESNIPVRVIASSKSSKEQQGFAKNNSAVTSPVLKVFPCNGNNINSQKTAQEELFSESETRSSTIREASKGSVFTSKVTPLVKAADSKNKTRQFNVTTHESKPLNKSYQSYEAKVNMNRRDGKERIRPQLEKEAAKSQYFSMLARREGSKMSETGSHIKKSSYFDENQVAELTKTARTIETDSSPLEIVTPRNMGYYTERFKSRNAGLPGSALSSARGTPKDHSIKLFSNKKPQYVGSIRPNSSQKEVKPSKKIEMGSPKASSSLYQKILFQAKMIKEDKSLAKVDPKPSMVMPMTSPASATLENTQPYFVNRNVKSDAIDNTSKEASPSNPSTLNINSTASAKPSIFKQSRSLRQIASQPEGLSPASLKNSPKTNVQKQQRSRNFASLALGPESFDRKEMKLLGMYNLSISENNQSAESLKLTPKLMKDLKDLGIESIEQIGLYAEKSKQKDQNNAKPQYNEYFNQNQTQSVKDAVKENKQLEMIEANLRQIQGKCLLQPEESGHDRYPSFGESENDKKSNTRRTFSQEADHYQEALNQCGGHKREVSEETGQKKLMFKSKIISNSISGPRELKLSESLKPIEKPDLSPKSLMKSLSLRKIACFKPADDNKLACGAAQACVVNSSLDINDADPAIPNIPAGSNINTKTIVKKVIDIYQRNSKWLSSKEEKIQKIAIKKKEEEMRECTFKPHRPLATESENVFVQRSFGNFGSSQPSSESIDGLGRQSGSKDRKIINPSYSEISSWRKEVGSPKAGSLKSPTNGTFNKKEIRESFIFCTSPN